MDAEQFFLDRLRTDWVNARTSFHPDGRGGGAETVRAMTLEIEKGIRELQVPDAAMVMLLVRFFGRTVGTVVVPVSSGRVSPAVQESAIRETLNDRLASLLVRDWLEANGERRAGGLMNVSPTSSPAGTNGSVNGTNDTAIDAANTPPVGTNTVAVITDLGADPALARLRLDAIPRLPGYEQLCLVPERVAADLGPRAVAANGNRIHLVHGPSLHEAFDLAVRRSSAKTIVAVAEGYVPEHSWIEALTAPFATQTALGASFGIPIARRMDTNGQHAREAFDAQLRQFIPWSTSADVTSGAPRAPNPTFLCWTFADTAVAFRRTCLDSIGGILPSRSEPSTTFASTVYALLFRALVRNWRVSSNPDAIIWYDHSPAIEACSTEALQVGRRARFIDFLRSELRYSGNPALRLSTQDFAAPLRAELKSIARRPRSLHQVDIPSIRLALAAERLSRVPLTPMGDGVAPTSAPSPKFPLRSEPRSIASTVIGFDVDRVNESVLAPENFVGDVASARELELRVTKGRRLLGSASLSACGAAPLRVEQLDAIATQLGHRIFANDPSDAEQQRCRGLLVEATDRWITGNSLRQLELFDRVSAVSPATGHIGIVLILVADERSERLTELVSSMSSAGLQPDRDRVIVVDRSPDQRHHDRVRATRATDVEVTFLNAPGGSWAEAVNPALSKLPDDNVIAFVDPSALVDPGWADEIRRVFSMRQTTVLIGACAKSSVSTVAQFEHGQAVPQVQTYKDHTRDTRDVDIDGLVSVSSTAYTNVAFAGESIRILRALCVQLDQSLSTAQEIVAVAILASAQLGHGVTVSPNATVWLDSPKSSVALRSVSRQVRSTFVLLQRVSSEGRWFGAPSSPFASAVMQAVGSHLGAGRKTGIRKVIGVAVDAIDSLAIASPEGGSTRFTPTRIFTVGGRYGHHASVSGYERSFETVAQPCLAVPFRWSNRRVRYEIDQALCRMSGNPAYSLGAALSELLALPKMLTNRRAVFHYIYGETDSWILPLLARHFDVAYSASLHLPPARFEELGIDLTRFQHARQIIVVDHDQFEYVERLVAPAPVYRVPIGIDTSYFARSSGNRYQNESRSQSSQFVLCVGSHLRDFSTLFEAWRLVGSDWSMHESASAMPELVLVGCSEEAKKAVSFMGLRNVRVSKRVSDDELRSLYWSAQALVMPLEGATANTALLEAFASSTPIITTDMRATRSYLGPFATYVKQGAADELAAAIVAVASPTCDGTAGQLHDRSDGPARDAALRRFDYSSVQSEIRDLLLGNRGSS